MYVLIILMVLTFISCCSSINCATWEVQCTNGNCVDKGVQCDDHDDCGDNSDELACGNNCMSGEFRCQNDECVDADFRCDGEDDCGDNSDELGCGDNCRSGEFQCQNSECVEVDVQCDGNKDCEDSSDELGCDSNCSVGDFLCKNGACVVADFTCDGDNDCGDYSDELGCGNTCSSFEFQCETGICISILLQCNGKMDCKGNLDEQECETAEFELEENSTHIFSRSVGRSLSLLCFGDDNFTNITIRQIDGQTLNTSTSNLTTILFEQLQCEHMGSYICDKYSNGTLHSSTVKLLVKDCPPMLCPGETSNKTMEAELYSNISFTICVRFLHFFYDLDFKILFNNDPCYFKNSNLNSNCFANQFIDNRKDTIQITLLNVTEKDFGKNSFKFMTGTIEFFSYTIDIENIVDFKQGENNTYTVIRRVGDLLKLRCYGDGNASSLTLRYTGGQALNQTTSKLLSYALSSLECDHVGVYTCEQFSSGGKQSSSMNLVVKPCPLILCPEEPLKKTLKVKLYSDVSFTICVWILDHYSPTEMKLLLNNAECDFTDCTSRCCADKITNKIPSIINVKITNVTEGDLGENILKLVTRKNFTNSFYVINYTLNFELKAIPRGFSEFVVVHDFDNGRICV